MNCIDKYKRKMIAKGGSIKNERIKDTERFFIDSFKNNPSHRVSKRTNINLIEDVIDIQLINKNNSVYEKKIHVLPNVGLSIGDYIDFEHKGKRHVYMIDEVEDNAIVPWGTATECRNVLKWIDENNVLREFPICASYTSYGTKIFVSESDFFDGISTNIDIEIPRNKITETIPLNLRFMLGKSKNGCYIVGDCSVYKENKLKLICRKDRFIPDYDDIENGLCWNKNISETNPNPSPTEYIISGQEEIKKSTTQTYTISPIHENGVFELLENDGSVEIVNQDNSSITLRGVLVGGFDTIQYKINNEVVTTFDVLVVR